MRLSFPQLCLFIGSAHYAISDEPSPVPASPTRLDAPIVIGEFVPPEPVPPKEIPAMRVESAVNRHIDGKRITVLRGEPSTLPDIPRPVAPRPPTPEEIAAREAFAARQPKTVFLQMGATVYDHRVSVVNWSHPARPEIRYEAVVGLDFSLFATITNFTHKNVPHHLVLMHHHLPTKVFERWGRKAPELPGVAAEAWQVIQGNTADATGMAPFTALMDLYAVEKQQLLAANAAVKRNLADAQAWRQANPPPPEPAQRTFWLRPHRGSRYLQPEGGAR